MLKLLNFTFGTESHTDAQFNILFYLKLISGKFEKHFAPLSCDFSEAVILFSYYLLESRSVSREKSVSFLTIALYSQVIEKGERVKEDPKQRYRTTSAAWEQLALVYYRYCTKPYSF